jgi:molybdenum cofactor cytidylyltransferase
MHTSLLLLAAGASSRLGLPKMFLYYKGKTLLHHITDAAMDVVPSPLFVVAGEHTQAIRNILQGHTAMVLHNDHWQEGMGGSIRTGIQGILDAGYAPESVLITVCDQPFITPDLLNALITAKTETGKGIIACSYDETIGTPVLFDKQYYPNLLELNGQHGAKKILQQFPDDVTTVPFPQGGVDIDTPEDYERLCLGRD